ncbi:hypothetical protein ACO0SA_001221 [Hanseniaspora valbyensis]
MTEVSDIKHNTGSVLKEQETIQHQILKTETNNINDKSIAINNNDPYKKEEQLNKEEEEEKVENEEDEEEVPSDAETDINTSKSKQILNKQSAPTLKELIEEDASKTYETKLKQLNQIEEDFASYRQNLYNLKLKKLQYELFMILDGSHPSLNNYIQSLQKIKDNKFKKINSNLKHKLNCINKETKATRCSIHQNYMKNYLNLKEKIIIETTNDWYDINNEKRYLDMIEQENTNKQEFINKFGVQFAERNFINNCNIINGNSSNNDNNNTNLSILKQPNKYHLPLKIENKSLSMITNYATKGIESLPKNNKASYRKALTEDLLVENINFQFSNDPVDKLEVIVDRMRFNNMMSDFVGLRKFYGAFPSVPDLPKIKELEILQDFNKIHKDLTWNLKHFPDKMQRNGNINAEGEENIQKDQINYENNDPSYQQQQ